MIVAACERTPSTSLMPRLANYRIIILGEAGTEEMRGVLETVSNLFRDAVISRYPASAGKPLPDNADRRADLVIICQSYPDQFNHQDVRSLLERFPLSRFVCCFGLWCESDGRNRDIWPVGTRVPVRLVSQRLLQERAVLAGRKNALPLTAGRDEAFAFDYTFDCGDYSDCGNSGHGGQERTTAKGSRERSASSVKAPRRKAVVLSPDRPLRRYWEETLRQSDYAVGSKEDGSAADLILFDADPWSPEQAARLRKCRAQHPAAIVVALMNFMRPEDEATVRAHGANAVCAKLSSPAQLLRMIRKAAFVSNGGF